MLRTLVVVFALLACVVPTQARADFMICNKSPTRAMSVAWALQHGTFITSPYNVGGWKHIAPNRCEFLGRGDLAGATIWVRAVSQGTVLTRGKRPVSSRLHDSTQQFCVADEEFAYDHRDAGATRDCGPGRYLATFPVTIWRTDDLADLSIDMNPDDFPAANASGAPGRGPHLPDLHGAVAVASNGTYYAHYLDESRAVAQQKALAYCASEEQSGAQCRLDASFSNQCIAVAAGASGHTYSGQLEWSRAQTLSGAMSKCEQSEGGQCKEVIAACSTYAELSAQRNRQDAQGQKQVLGVLGNALRALYGNAAPATPQPSERPGQAFEPLVQICTPLVVDARGKFLPAAQAAIDNGDMGRHFEAVDRILDAMKADSQGILRTVQQAHVQLVIPGYRSADKTPRVQTVATTALLRCPVGNNEVKYALAEWLREPGMSPYGLPRR